MDHSKEFPYRRVSFPVVCANGFIADAATGKRLFYNPEAGAYMPMGKKKVWKNTAQPYYTEVFQLREGLLTYQVLRANAINKHGLVWEAIFSGALKPKVRDPVYEQGVGTMVSWLKSEQARELITPGLLLPDRDSTPTDVIEALWKRKHRVCSCETLRELAVRWLDGQVDQVLENTFHAEMKKKRFGIELEFTGMSRKAAAAILGSYFGSRPRYAGGTYDKWEVPDRQGRPWAILRDSSIRAEVRRGVPWPEGEDLKCELVTPILGYQDIETLLQPVIRLLRKQGKMRVNSSCGIHVHVGAERLTARQLVNLLHLQAANQDLIYRCLGVDAERLVFCHKLDGQLLNRIARTRPSTIPELQHCWYGTEGQEPRRHYHPSRYVGLNYHSFFQGHGVEWRMFNATSHAGKVKSYIQLCLAMMTLAEHKTWVKPSSQKRGTDLALMRRLLNELELTGDEFATARLHLTALAKKAAAEINEREAA